MGLRLGLLWATCASGLACASVLGIEDGVPRTMGDGGVATGTVYDYVQNELLVPDSNAEADDYGLNIDDDVQNRPDNSFGRFLVLDPAGDAKLINKNAVTSGEVLHLFRMQADSLGSDASVNWQVHLGESSGVPNFSGSGTFSIAADSPPAAIVPGAIIGGQFKGGTGSVVVRIKFGPGAPLPMELHGVKIQANVTATGCSAGKLGGGMKKSYFDTTFIPQLHAYFSGVVTSDPGCPSACGSSAQSMLSLFDANMDKSISLTEVRDNSLIRTVLAPDVDLFNAAGDYAPGSDGVKDAISIGFRFTCVKATF